MSSHLLSVGSSFSQARLSPSSRSTNLSRHSLKSESECDIQEQMRELKEKAHKSFLQVIQMESLHQEEIESVREEFEEELEIFRKRQAQLLGKLKKYEEEPSNHKKFAFDVPNTSFTLDNIDCIDFRDNQESRFEDSSLLNIRELLTQRDSAAQEKLAVLQNQMRREIQHAIEAGNQENLVKGILDKVFAVFGQINSENIQLRQKTEEIFQNLQKAETQVATLKIQYDSAQKQSKFLSQHIKRIHNDKTALEKKSSDLQKNKKFLEETIRSLKKALSTNGINLGVPKRKDSAGMLSMANEDIEDSQNCFSLSSSTKLQRMTSESGIGYQVPLSTSNTLKNFRKKDTLTRMDHRK